MFVTEQQTRGEQDLSFYEAYSQRGKRQVLGKWTRWDHCKLWYMPCLKWNNNDIREIGWDGVVLNGESKKASLKSCLCAQILVFQNQIST